MVIHILEIADKDFKTALINMLKKIMEKAGTFTTMNKNLLEISR